MEESDWPTDNLNVEEMIKVLKANIEAAVSMTFLLKSTNKKERKILKYIRKLMRKKASLSKKIMKTKSENQSMEAERRNLQH